LFYKIFGNAVTIAELQQSVKLSHLKKRRGGQKIKEKNTV